MPLEQFSDTIRRCCLLIKTHFYREPDAIALRVFGFFVTLIVHVPSSMHTLAIETSSSLGSIAIQLADGPPIEAEFAAGQSRGQSLIPQIQSLLDFKSVLPQQIGLVAVSLGPGSYTGLRVGVTCAKMLAWANRAPLVAVNTHHAIAHSVPPSPHDLCVVSDALRDSLYLTRFRFDTYWVETEPTRVVPVEHFCASLSQKEIVCGTPVVYENAIRAMGAALTESHQSVPRAAAVATVGIRMFHSGLTVSPASLTPLYLRQSSAETQWDRLHQGRK